MPETREIPYRDMPGLSALFLDYLDLLPGALRFYQKPPTIAGIEQLARGDLRQIARARSGLAAILERQNSALGAGNPTFERIRELANADCVAVVTGQQVGLFAGPLYTIYKALAAIRLADELRSRGIGAVPVFWMECEDHDLAEVTHVTAIAADSAIRRLDFREFLYGDIRESARSVGTLTLPQSIQKVTEEYAALLPDGKYKESIRSALESAYQPGTGFADAFGRFMTHLFQERGLIFFNPADLEAKRLAAPVFQKAIHRTDAIHRLIAGRNQELATAGYHSQVNFSDNSTVLFLLEGNERRAVIRDGAGFTLKNSDHSYSAADLLRLTEEAPERFSPNVLLRPLIQDRLFPTVAYVGGPAEIAYFSQIEVLYRLFEMPMPVIWPRASFTLLEPEIHRTLVESGIEVADCLRGRQVVTEKMNERVSRSGISAGVKSLGEQLDRTLAGIRPELVFAEASLGAALDTAKRKMLHNVEALHAKLVQFEARQNGGSGQKVDFILNHCAPNKSLQEREFGAPVFLSRHGRPLLDAIYSEIKVESFMHRAIVLDAIQ